MERILLKNRFREYYYIEKKKQTNKTKKQKISFSSVPLTPYKISISSSLHISIVSMSALNWSLRDIMRTVTRILLLFASGVANATEDQVKNGKHIHS